MHTARLFGLDVEAGFDLAGIPPGPIGRRRPVALTLVSRAEAFASWPARGARPLTRTRGPDGRRLHPIDQHPREGTLMRAPGWGVYRIDRQVSRIVCAPVRGAAAWRWQRYLLAQVLPFAAVLSGLEAWHAGVVAIDGRAVALVGGSRSGKSTVAASLLERGGTLVTDDVAALERRDGEVVVHPGPPLMSVRRGALPPDRVGRLGAVLGDDGEATRVQVPPAGGPAPLAAVVLLDRRPERGLTLRRAEPPDPRTLLGATFNAVIVDPQRLVAGLELCAAVAARVPVLEARIGASTGPAEVAAAIEQAVAR